MIYPIMVQIDFRKVIQAGKTPKPVGVTLFVNWLIKPFTMAFFAWLFMTIEVPVMLTLVKICLRTQHWFPSKGG